MTPEEERREAQQRHNRFVNGILVVCAIATIIFFIWANNQPEPSTEYGCVYDPRDGSKSCLHN